MKHAVIYDKCGNKWDTALPLGNSVFGCMMFYEDAVLHMPMNHYEVYHTRMSLSMPEETCVLSKKIPTDHDWHQEYLERGARNVAKGDETFIYYRPGYERTNNSEKDHANNGTGLGGASHPMTGELNFYFDERLEKAKSRIALYTEDAKTKLTLKNENQNLAVETIVSREDCIINKICQSEEGLLKSILIDFSPHQSAEMPAIVYREIDEYTFGYIVTRKFDDSVGKTFVFSGIIRLIGARGKLQTEENGARIIVTEAKNEITILTGIFTDWKYTDTLKEGVEKMNGFQKNLSRLYDDHKKYWKEFFDRSSISIPDPFLEHIYYVNQYALDCSSGKDGIMKHQACGLSGLWGIRNPYIWPSTWYWDVNIQAAFSGVFSSNRLDLGKVFSDGLLRYSENAEVFAEKYHHMSGCSADYPHHFYFCIWPWCAQYLWFQYEYSLDKEYLRNDAYPLFIKILEFFLQAFKYDKATDTFNIFPDISPEQGPLAHNTTITIASVKYFLKFTLKAAEILEDKNPLLKECKILLDKLPPYSFSKDGLYGVHLKDSPDAPDNMWIRHPSMLMPLFPTGEFDMDSGEEIKEILENTIKFLEDRCEIGIFGGSWIAAGAARLGKGQMALRLLYERGIDHMLRTSGLSAEATERFMNHCLICGGPRFYPDMMEFTGQMLAVVNEMLLQSHNNVVRVFPALPDGDPETYRMHQHGYAIHEYHHRFATYEAWKTVRFDKLLAKGAFEISASLKDGNLKWILVHSKKGEKINLWCPYLKKGIKVTSNGKEIKAEYKDKNIKFETHAGESYLIAVTPDAYTPKDKNEDYNTEILTRKTYTKRNLFIGENSDTGYYKALDGFMRSWYLGNIRMENHSVGKFDFSADENKVYEDFLPPQSYGAIEMLMMSNTFQPVGENNMKYTTVRGYGFTNCNDIKIVSRKEPDLLRKDFAEGSEETKFMIYAPRGQYELLVISGDAEEESLTILETENGARYGGEVLAKGSFQCELIPIVQKKDTPIRLKISTDQSHHWKLNVLMVNSLKGY